MLNKSKHNEALFVRKEMAFRKAIHKVIDLTYSCYTDATFSEFVKMMLSGFESIALPVKTNSPGSSLLFLGDAIVFSGDTLLNSHDALIDVHSICP